MRIYVEHNLVLAERLFDVLRTNRFDWQRPFLDRIGHAMRLEIQRLLKEPHSLHPVRHPVTHNQSASLYDSGELHGGTSYWVESRDYLNVGWTAMESRRAAVVQELGISIGLAPSSQPPPGHWRASERGEYELQAPVTEGQWARMRAWFEAQGYPLGEETMAIYIPARPFIVPAVVNIFTNTPLIENELTWAIEQAIAFGLPGGAAPAGRTRRPTVAPAIVPPGHLF